MRGVSVLLWVAALCSLAACVRAQEYAATTWTSGAHATFYGGTDASGTMGGACGYGNLYSQGYGTNTAALSSALFDNGLSCGACFALQCDTSQESWCYGGGNALTVTATNYCPQGSFGGWCDSPKPHFDLAYPAFTQLAPATVGVIPVQFMRVPCVKIGGLLFTISGNPYYTSILITNVGGAGNVKALSVQGSQSGLLAMNRAWGQVWTQGVVLVGQSLSFQVTVGDASFLQTSLFSNVVPSNWAFGQTFESSSNFNSL